MGKPQKLSKFTYFTAFMILIVGIVAVLALIVRKNPFSSTTSELCFDKECIGESRQLLYNMNASANPCDDFYEFACGNYAHENQLNDDVNQIDDMQKVKDETELRLKTLLEMPPKKDEAVFFKNLKIFYKDCNDKETINQLGLNPMNEILSSIGGWPVLSNTTSENDWWNVLLAIRANNLNAQAMLETNVGYDISNSSVRIINIKPPDFILTRETKAKGKTDKDVQKYLKYITRIAVLFGADEKTAADEMEHVLDFEILLAQAAKSKEEKSGDQKALHNIYTLEKLEGEFSGFPWAEYVKAMTPKNFKLTANRTFQLEEPEYVRKLIDYLEITPNRTIINYMIISEIASFPEKLNDDFGDVFQDFMKDVVGVENREKRYKQCMKLIEDNLGTLQSSLYVRSFFDAETKTAASEMVDQMKVALKETLKNANFGEDETAILEKVDAMNSMVGYPEELLDDAKLGEFYNTMEIVEGEFFKSSLLVNKASEFVQYSLLDKPVNKTDWIYYTGITGADAFYISGFNTIVISATLLQGNFYNAKRPNYLNYATIGSIIGHEMLHGFDEKGRQLDKNGDLTKLSQRASDDFSLKKKCVIDQYDKYTIFDGQHVKGSATVSENLADIGGKKIAYTAYKNWMKSQKTGERLLPGLDYSLDQVYWISAASSWCVNEREKQLSYRITADIHAPHRFRINGPFSNLDEFAEAFNCPVGSNMNPATKCKPW